MFDYDSTIKLFTSTLITCSLVLLLVFLTACSEREYTYNAGDTYTTYDLRDACNAAAQEVGREVSLDDNANIVFDGSNCRLEFN